MPWLRNEDAAIKMKLQGLQVFDGNAPTGRSVPVRYRLPEDELANLSYPIIIIEHAGLYPDPAREHRGYIQVPYVPEGYAPWWNPAATTINPAESPYYSYFPLPYNFDYQITLYGRFMTQHIQPLVTTLATEQYLPYHMGYLQIPQDGTTRSMFLQGGPEFSYGKDEDGKRIFKVSYLIRVFSEIVPAVTAMAEYGGTLVPVNTVDIDLSVYSDTNDLVMDSPAEIEKNIGIYSFGIPVQFNTEQLP
jgi:hypothetical protein